MSGEETLVVLAFHAPDLEGVRIPLPGLSPLDYAEAHGGLVGAAATGGVRNNLTWVGEHGPELVRLPPGTMVHSNPDSQRMAAGQNGAPVAVNLYFEPNGGGQFESLLMELMRKAVRVRGGNVQAVLGR